MGQIVVNVGSFDLTSHNGNTAYSSLKKFDIPANAGITKCVATFAQHVNTGSFQGKSFSLNGAQAHPNTPWPTSGIELNPALLSTGENSFKAAVKSQAGLSARWAIGDIYLTITYNDVGGGGGTTDPGVISLNKTSLTAGESVTVSVTGVSGGVYRDIYIYTSSAHVGTVVQGHGSGTGSWTVTIPESWCETHSPDDPSFEIQFYMAAYIAGGADVGSGAKMLTVNVPASAVPTIGAFTATRDANGVDASITKYVQNYSKVNLAMGSVAGALGSSIASYEITGAGFSAAAASATMGPFGQTGDITFTAKVTDTRGRTATRTVTINVLSYGPPAFSNPEAWRSSNTGVKNQKGTYARLKSGVVYSSLGGQNSVTLKGMVHIKGGTVPAYTSMTPDTAWITGGGLLLVTKTYIAQMIVQDKITSKTIEFTIPTKKTGISIMAGMQGIAFGKSVEIPGVAEFGWPVIAPGLAPNPNLLHNWDFLNPINQRGASGLISSGSYFVDRWIWLWGQMVVNAGYLTIKVGSELGQKIENPALSGAAVTASIKVGGVVYSVSGAFPSTAGVRNDIALTGFGEIRIGIDSSGVPYFSIVSYADRNVQAVKLELGPVSTLHLDPPMDWGVELPKCQRYYEKLGTGMYFIAYSANSVIVSSPFAVYKRTTPSFSLLTGTMTLTDALANYTATTLTMFGQGGDKRGLRQAVLSGFTGLTPGKVYYCAEYYDGIIGASSDL